MAELQRLTTQAELDRLIDESHHKPVMIFKHSLTCGISAGAYRELERYLDELASDDVAHALIEVQSSRALCQAVAERTGVRHASPQALVLRDGEVVWHTSHGRIRRAALAEAVAS